MTLTQFLVNFTTIYVNNQMEFSNLAMCNEQALSLAQNSCHLEARVSPR